MMVQTRAAAKRVESGNALQLDTAVVPSPIKKRRQDGVSSKKRRREDPGELCQLNLDVLFLLAAYVHPLDLLNLARTCKSLRHLLMNKASTFVWKTARRQFRGLPDCPDDLTEPEYANLVFYARCHGCGKYAKKVFWSIRRRYCPDCRLKRLRSLASCPAVIYDCALPTEILTINCEKTRWVDGEQLESFIREHDRSSNKDQFLNGKRAQYFLISSHARRCREWEMRRAWDHKDDLVVRRQKRYESIFERLKEHGYGPEVEYFADYRIEQSRKSFFKSSKPLTDKEWTLMLPDWIETMEIFRIERMEMTVYRPRRDQLASEYDDYVMSRSPNTPVLELLPHATKLACLIPFREVVYAPEGADIGPKPFETAFEQLPALVDEWKKQLDAEFCNLIVIPSHLSSEATASGQGVVSSSATCTESSQVATEKLRLACAVFSEHSSVAYYPEVLSFVPVRLRAHPVRELGSSESTLSIKERFGVKFVSEAPYIVHACGLDPNVATVEDMDRRNARLMCLSCNRSYVMTWRGAVRHVLYFHPTSQMSLPGSSCWQLIGDEHMGAIQAAELSFKIKESLSRMRCLLCYPRVGCGMFRKDVMDHIVERHGVEAGTIQQGVHYKSLTLDECRPGLWMDDVGGTVTFKEPLRHLF